MGEANEEQGGKKEKAEEEMAVLDLPAEVAAAHEAAVFDGHAIALRDRMILENAIAGVSGFAGLDGEGEDAEHGFP